MTIHKSTGKAFPVQKASILTEFEQAKREAMPERKAMPKQSELERSRGIQQKCADIGFDWPEVGPVIAKVNEELDEVQEAIDNPQKTHKDIEEELGDLLFACVNLCRHLDVSPEQAISQANTKFIKRFQYIETRVFGRGENLQMQSLETLEALWLEAKQKNSQ